MDEDSKKKYAFSSKTMHYGKIALVVSTAVFLSYFTIKNLDVVAVYAVEALNKFISTIAPLILGIILAFLFNRPVKFFESLLGKLKNKRVVSIGILYILILGAISLIINFIVPSIQKSLMQLIYFDLPGYSNIISSNFQNSLEWLKSIGITFDYSNIPGYVSQFSSISSLILDGIMILVKALTQGLFNFTLAMILAFYMLQRKEKLLGFLKELILLYGGKRLNSLLLNEAKDFNGILNSYISGMFIDTIIVSVLIIIGLRITGHKYFLLMGVAIGILNLIPYFGSIIGVAIACLLALFQGLPTALYSLIALVIIQQIDANIIQPRIVGNRVGLEPFWVITAILVFGSYWGILGMIVAVPFTALIKTIVKKVIQKKREKLKKCQVDAKIS